MFDRNMLCGPGPDTEIKPQPNPTETPSELVAREFARPRILLAGGKEFANGPQRRRSDLDESRDRGGLHSDPSGVRPHLQLVGGSSSPEGTSVGKLPLHSGLATGQADRHGNSQGSQALDAYRSNTDSPLVDELIQCPVPGCYTCRMLRNWEPLPKGIRPQIERAAATPKKVQPVTFSECIWFALKYALGLFLIYVAAMHFLGGAL